MDNPFELASENKFSAMEESMDMMSSSYKRLPGMAELNESENHKLQESQSTSSMKSKTFQISKERMSQPILHKKEGKEGNKVKR